jgi:hypothetical protein
MNMRSFVKIGNCLYASFAEVFKVIKKNKEEKKK